MTRPKTTKRSSSASKIIRRSKEPDPNTPFKSRLMLKQRELLANKLAIALSDDAVATRSSTAREKVVYDSNLAKRIAFEINESPCLYCCDVTSSACIVKTHKRSICFERDVQNAYDLLMETEDAAVTRKARINQDKADIIAARAELRRIASNALRVAALVEKRKQNDMRAAFELGKLWLLEVNQYFEPTYRLSANGDMRAQLLLEELLPTLKETLELWSNGGPAFLATAEEEALEHLDNEVVVADDESDLADVNVAQFNLILLEIDISAEKLATKYFRTFGGVFLKGLQHGNAAADYTPAIQSSSELIPSVKFGARRKGVKNKTAAEISKNRYPRSRARSYMMGRFDGLTKSVAQLTEAIDEVNRRPSTRIYRPAITNDDIAPIATDIHSVDEQLVKIEEEISDRESQLRALYIRRARLLKEKEKDLHLNTASPVVPKTKAIVLVSGPHAHYDSISMFDLKTNIPDSDPLQGFFQAMYSIRETTAADTMIEAVTSSGEIAYRKKSRHEVNTSASIAASKGLI